MTRKIDVYPTVGNSTGFTITTDATTFSAILSELSQNGVDFNASTMKAVAATEDTQTELLSSSVLPDTDFVLFVMPKRTKSGRVSY